MVRITASSRRNLWRYALRVRFLGIVVRPCSDLGISFDSDNGSKEAVYKAKFNNRYNRHRSADYTPNLKRGLERMERSLGVNMDTELPQSVLREIESEGKRAWREESNRLAEFASRIRECTSLLECKRLHDEMKECGLRANTFLGNVLVQMYSKCGSLENARAVFGEIPKKNVYSYNLMIAALTQNGQDEVAIKLFKRMQKQGIEPDGFTLASIIGAYAKTGRLDGVRRVFDNLVKKDVATWTAMIAAYSQNGNGKEALELYRRMDLEGVHPNMMTFASVLDSCTNLREGKAIHQRALASGCKLDVVIETALLNMYTKCGNLDDARRIFEKLHRRNVISFTAMIAAYAQNGHAKEALELYRRMESERVVPNMITFASVLNACSTLGALEEGKAIHARILKDSLQLDSVVENALLSMYAKAGGDCSLESARMVFEKMQDKDVSTWNAMISGYAQKGHVKEALEVYRRMESEGVKPDRMTYVSIIGACSDQGDLEDGKELHARLFAGMSQPDMAMVESALVNMYGKCGSLDDARKVFDKMQNRDVAAWNSMISAYAQHGHGDKGLALYHMMALEGAKPNDITFTSILLVCSHAGLQAAGREYFLSMIEDHEIAPVARHYQCMVDVLGRGGRLKEAEELITSMPYPQDAAAWGSLLSACKNHGDMDRAARAADKAFELGPNDASPYVLLSGIYAAAGRWADVEKVRKIMKEKGIEKPPCCSMEMNSSDPTAENLS